MNETPIGSEDWVQLLDPMTRRPLPVRWVDPNALTENPDHPRDQIHGGDSRYQAGLVEMRDSGFHAPLLALSDGFLVDGHRRLAIARELGLTRVPVCYVSGPQFRKIWASYDPQSRATLLRQRYFLTVLARIAAL